MSKCNICELEPAIVDGKTIHGPWANMCAECFKRYGIHVTGLYTMLPSEQAPGNTCKNSPARINNGANS